MKMSIPVSLLLLQIIPSSWAGVIQLGMPEDCLLADPPNCDATVTIERVDDDTDDRVKVTLKATVFPADESMKNQYMAVGFSETGRMASSSIAECLVGHSGDPQKGKATFISSVGANDPYESYSRCQDNKLTRSVISEPRAVSKEGGFYVCEFTYAVRGQTDENKGCVVRPLDKDLHILLAYGYAKDAKPDTTIQYHNARQYFEKSNIKDQVIGAVITTTETPTTTTTTKATTTEATTTEIPTTITTTTTEATTTMATVEESEATTEAVVVTVETTETMEATNATSNETMSTVAIEQTTADEPETTTPKKAAGEIRFHLPLFVLVIVAILGR